MLISRRGYNRSERFFAKLVAFKRPMGGRVSGRAYNRDFTGGTQLFPKKNIRTELGKHLTFQKRTLPEPRPAQKNSAPRRF